MKPESVTEFTLMRCHPDTPVSDDVRSVDRPEGVHKVARAGPPDGSKVNPPMVPFGLIVVATEFRQSGQSVGAQ
jgi:hypothetical protein